MKNNKVNQESNKAMKNPTTNYPMDSHKSFCKRCMNHNGCCPITGNKPSKNCDI